MRFDPQWNTHLPLLIEALRVTNGPVLEIGMGIGSTPVLHSLCADRFLLSQENDPNIVKMFRKYEKGNHKIELVNWEDAQTAARWSVVLIDHKPEERRKEDIKLLANLADYIVVHDTEPESEQLYKYSEVYPLFKYRFDDKRQPVHTTILSNFHDLNFLHNPIYKSVNFT